MTPGMSLSETWVTGQAATGVQPFDDDSAPAIMRHHLHDTPPPPRQHSTGLTPLLDGPVEFGVHSAVAEHYGVEPEREITTTLDYVMAAAGG